MNSPEDGPVDPKHVEIRRCMSEVEAVTSVGFSFPVLYILIRILLKPYKNVGHFTSKLGMFQIVDRNTDNALLCLHDCSFNIQYIFDSDVYQQHKGKVLLPFLGNSGYANALQFYFVLQCLPCYRELCP